MSGDGGGNGAQKANGAGGDPHGCGELWSGLVGGYSE